MAYGTVNTDIVADSSGGRLSPISSVFRNRIINGAMVIDQRNAGASYTATTANGYCLDRWQTNSSASSKYTVQQNAGSVTPPVGFANYLGVTSSAATSVASGDYYYLTQSIEGFNWSDMAWGTASAKTVTLSFQVYSSLTGTFGGSLQNGTQGRSYPFTYTVSSANTWTPISITIAGDTGGTWIGNTNGRALYLVFGLGMGSTYSGTAGSWSSSNYLSATGATSVVGTNGATFYITGVQLEVGSSATGFDYRPYGTELNLCQRYFEKSFDQATAVGTATYLGVLELYGSSDSGGNIVMGTIFKVEKRTSPTMNFYNGASGAATWEYGRSGATGTGSPTPYRNSTSRMSAYINTGLAWVVVEAAGQWTASAEL